MEGQNRDRSGGVGRRTVLKTAAAAGGVLALPGAALAQAGTPRRGGTLRVAMPYNPASLDPINGRNPTDFNTLYGVFDGLLQLNPKTLEVLPNLATSFTWTDAQTLTLELAQGVRFHDGTSFDADAVKFNIERYKTDPRSNVKQDLIAVDSVEVASPSKVVLHLGRPNAALPAMLTDRGGMMVSPTSIRNAAGGNVDRAPVGSGPFKFKSWADTEKIEMVRNDDYWRKGQPYLDGVVLNIISDPPTVLRSVTAEENDLAINITLAQKAVADRAGNLVVTTSPTLVINGMYFNYGNDADGKPRKLADLRVRQAICWAVDRDAFNQAISMGLGEVSSSPRPKVDATSDDATRHFYGYDPDKARKLLADAGYPNGIDLDVLGWADSVSMRSQELVMDQLSKVGIRCHLTPMSPQDSSAEFFIKKHGDGRFPLVGVWAEASQEYGNLFGKSGYFNASGIELPGFADLYAATQASLDPPTRKAAFAKLQRFVIENALVLVIEYQPNMTVATKKVHGLWYDPEGRARFHEAWLDA